MILQKANREWASRPADQRFKSLEDLDRACTFHRNNAIVQTLPMRDLRLEARGDQMVLVKGGGSGVGATISNWPFTQLCGRLRSPAGFLRELPSTLAVQVLNHRLAKLVSEPDRSDDQAQLLIQRNGGLKLRGLTSDIYDRIWDNDVTARLLRLQQEHPEWQPAPAAFDGSRGLYASEHDMFAFLVDNDRRIFESKNGGLSRGFFVWNSEVGARSFGIMTFLYEFVCGNHIVWGASDVLEARIRHVGNANERAWGQILVTLQQYAESSISDDQARIEAAMKFTLGMTKDEVLDAVLGLGQPSLTKARLNAAWDAANTHSDWYGDPKSAWGFVNGITEEARSIAFADERVAVERAAGKVLDYAIKPRRLPPPSDPALARAIAEAVDQDELVRGEEI